VTTKQLYKLQRIK